MLTHIKLAVLRMLSACNRLRLGCRGFGSGCMVNGMPFSKMFCMTWIVW